MVDGEKRTSAEDRDVVYQRLETKYSKLLYSLVTRYSHMVKRPDLYDDLIQEARIGLAMAIDTFENVHNAKFPTWAYYCIRGRLLHYLRDYAQMIRIPAWRRERGEKSPDVVRYPCDDTPLSDQKEPMTKWIYDEPGYEHVLNHIALQDTILRANLFPYEQHGLIASISGCSDARHSHASLAIGAKCARKKLRAALAMQK